MTEADKIKSTTEAAYLETAVLLIARARDGQKEREDREELVALENELIDFRNRLIEKAGL